MASHLSLRLPSLVFSSKCDRNLFDERNRDRGKVNSLYLSNFPVNEGDDRGISMDCLSLASSVALRRTSGQFSSGASLSRSVYSAVSGSYEDWTSVAKIDGEQVGHSRVPLLVRVLHESAMSFYSAIELLDLDANGAELSMAWIGKDACAWLRTLAYQVYTGESSVIHATTRKHLLVVLSDMDRYRLHILPSVSTCSNS